MTDHDPLGGHGDQPDPHQHGGTDESSGLPPAHPPDLLGLGDSLGGHGDDPPADHRSDAGPEHGQAADPGPAGPPPDDSHASQEHSLPSDAPAPAHVDLVAHAWDVDTPLTPGSTAFDLGTGVGLLPDGPGGHAADPGELLQASYAQAWAHDPWGNGAIAALAGATGPIAEPSLALPADVAPASVGGADLAPAADRVAAELWSEAIPGEAPPAGATPASILAELHARIDDPLVRAAVAAELAALDPRP